MKWTMDNGQRTTAIKSAIVILLLSAVVCHLSSQDIHFTQFFTNPLVLNPAQTGNFQGNYRIGFNFKGQWPFATNSSTYTYHTETPYVDLSFGEKKIKSGWMGVGFNFVNDEAGDGVLTYRKFSVSYAYHQAFDKEQRYVLSVGVNLSYVLRSVDFSKLYFNDQWVQEFGFNTSVNPNEPLLRQSFGMWDLGAGLNFAGQISKRIKIDVGYCMLHINQPHDNFYNDDERLGFRYQPTAGLTCNVSNRVTVYANAYYGYEKTASETVFGAMMSYGFYKFNKEGSDNLVYAGIYYRVNDAVAPLIGYQYKSMRMLLSYDITTSTLLPASQANGGPEISIVYVGGWEKEFNGKKVHCPKF